MDIPRPSIAKGAPGLLLLAFLVPGCRFLLDVPQWSPEGRYIAFTKLSARSAGAGENSVDLWLLDLRKARPPGRLFEGAGRPRWSPDGSRLFFVATEDAPAGDVDFHICSARLDGSDVITHARGWWYELAPLGERLFYLGGELKETLFALRLETGRAERLSAEGEKCIGAALDISGTKLAYAAKVRKSGKETVEIRLLDPAAGGRPRRIASLPSKKDSNRLLLEWLPGGERLIAAYDPVEKINLLPSRPGGRRKTIRPPAGGEILLLSTSPDEKWLFLTTWEDEKLRRMKIDLESGRGEVEAEIESEELLPLGGPSWDRTGTAVAEYTEAGLRVSAADGAWERLYPSDHREKHTAAERLIAAGRLDEALGMLDIELPAGEEEDRARRHLLEAKVLLALDERKDAAGALLGGWLLYPVSDVPDGEFLAQARALAGEDRLLDGLARALALEEGKRHAPLERALPLAGKSELVGGLNFRIAESGLAAGRPAQASKHFRLASESAAFPQADYAAALAALSRFVSGTNDAYARELLLRALDLFPASPLREDMRAALAEMERPDAVLLRRSIEAAHPSGLVAWTVTRAGRSLGYRLRPELADRAGAGRRLVLRTEQRCSLMVARGAERAGSLLKNVPTRIGPPAFSPDGKLIAFIAGGGPYVVGLDGKFVLGERGELFSGEPRAEATSGYIIWDPSGRALAVRKRDENGRPVSERFEVPARSGAGVKP